MDVRRHWLIYHFQHTVLSCINVLNWQWSGKQQIKTAGEKEELEEIEAGSSIDSQRRCCSTSALCGTAQILGTNAGSFSRLQLAD